MADMNQLIEQLQGFDINDVDWDRVGVWPVAVRVLLCFLLRPQLLLLGIFLLSKKKIMS
jgi:hypothetical protein